MTGTTMFVVPCWDASCTSQSTSCGFDKRAPLNPLVYHLQTWHNTWLSQLCRWGLQPPRLEAFRVAHQFPVLVSPEGGAQLAAESGGTLGPNAPEVGWRVFCRFFMSFEVRLAWFLVEFWRFSIFEVMLVKQWTFFFCGIILTVMFVKVSETIPNFTINGW